MGGREIMCGLTAECDDDSFLHPKAPPATFLPMRHKTVAAASPDLRPHAVKAALTPGEASSLQSSQHGKGTWSRTLRDHTIAYIHILHRPHRDRHGTFARVRAA